jgi:DNA-binding LacI/PurR family transcriptional regulator
MVGLEREIHQHNQILIPISVKHDGQESSDTIPNLLLSQDVDAAVIMGEVSTRTICSFFRTREIPTVIVDNKVGCSEFGYVCLDNLAGARAAAEHLLAQGYPRIVVIGGKTQITDQQPRSDSRERLEGVILALAAAGHAWDEKLLYKDEFVTPGGGQRGAAELLERWGTPLGIVCFDDLFAWQALRECQRRGLKVPEDVGIVGFNDIRSVTEMTTPTISSIRVPWEQVGYVAGRLVLEELKRPKQDQSLVVCPVKLITRESSNLRHVPVDSITA